MPLDALSRKVSRTQQLMAAITMFLVVFAASYTALMAYELAAVRAQQKSLEQLTSDLCATLQRAGILIHGSERNPCEP